MFEEWWDADKWFWKDDWFECDAIDMYIEEASIDDSLVDRLKGEEDIVTFSSLDSVCEFDMSEEELDVNGWFWKDDALECDAIDMKKEHIDDSSKDRLKEEAEFL